FAPGAPVVVFLEGPWDSYHYLPGDQCQDFWRLYAAEAYANGAFFAFLLKAPIAQATDGAGPGHPGRDAIVPRNADADGTMTTFEQLAGYYRGHAGLYHGTTRSLDAERAVTVKGG